MRIVGSIGTVAKGLDSLGLLGVVGTASTLVNDKPVESVGSVAIFGTDVIGLIC